MNMKQMSTFEFEKDTIIQHSWHIQQILPLRKLMLLIGEEDTVI